MKYQFANKCVVEITIKQQKNLNAQEAKGQTKMILTICQKLSDYNNKSDSFKPNTYKHVQNFVTRRQLKG
jgi:hypothetical protein